MEKSSRPSNIALFTCLFNSDDLTYKQMTSSAIRILFLIVNPCLSIILAPHTPCPEVFNYAVSQTNEVYGRITFKNDLFGEYSLEVNMTIPLDTNKTLEVYQGTTNLNLNSGDDVVYVVKFPDNETFPTVTSIVFNGRLHCIEHPVDAKAVTQLSAKSYITVKYLDRFRWAQPDIFRDINTFPKECGLNINFEPFIINGTSIENGQFPWLIAILVYGTNTKSYDFICGGTLITDRHIVTASHCVRDKFGVETKPDDIIVVLGTHTIRNWVKKATWRGVKRVSVHEDYIQPGDADITILFLDRPVGFSVNIKPICIWEEDNDVNIIKGQIGYVAGWGKNENNEPFVLDAKQVGLPVVAQDTCLLADPRYFSITSRRTFCAGDGNFKLACTGDSGGGFVMKHKGRWTLRGVVSAGLQVKDSSICDSKLYAVFADATKFRLWITDQIGSKNVKELLRRDE